MKKIKILVVEDEVIVADHLCDTLHELGYETTEIAINYTEAIILIEQEQPDLVILDIQLSGKKSGIDIAKKIREQYELPFIFLTSNTDKYTLNEVKVVSPPAFLVKPFSKEELYATIEITLSNLEKAKQYKIRTEPDNVVFVKTKKGLQKINVKSILYIKSSHVYLKLVLENGMSYLVRNTMSGILTEIGDQFIRTHRSYIVNTHYIQAFDGIKVRVLHTEIPVSKKYKELVLSRLNII